MRSAQAPDDRLLHEPPRHGGKRDDDDERHDEEDQSPPANDLERQQDGQVPQIDSVADLPR